MHPDAHFDPCFLKALKASVRQALPPAARRRWWKRALTALAVLLLLTGMVVMIALLGFAGVNAPPIAAAFGLFFAAMLAAPPGGQSNLAVFFRALTQHPAEPRHALHWLRRMETVTVCVFPGLALTSAVHYLIVSRSGAGSWLPLLSAALAAGLMTSGVYALLHFFPALKPLRWMALLIFFGTFFALQEKHEADTFTAQVFTALNPILWPLPALHRPLDSAEWLRLALGLAGSLAVIGLAWRTLPRCAARCMTMPGTVEGEASASAPRATFTLRIPAFLSRSESPGAPGFWERIIERTRTPQQRVLAELALIPGAPSLGRLFWRCVLRLALALAVVIAAGAAGFSEAALLLGGFAIIGIISKTLFRTPAADGFPFHPLTHARQQYGGQMLLPLSLLPVPWSAVSLLFLKSLWPRCVLVGCLFVPLGTVCDFLLNRWSSPPVSGLAATTGALLITVFAGTFSVLSFTHNLASQAGEPQHGWRCLGRGLAILALQVTAFFAGLAAIPLAFHSWARPHHWPWAAGTFALSLLAAAGAHVLLLRLLQRGDLDLWRIPPPTRRLLT